MHKPVLKLNPYFHVLTLIDINLNFACQLELSQIKVAIQVLWESNSIKSPLPIILVIIYVLAATNKRLLISESHDDLNRYTPCRGNLIHMTRTLSTPVHIRHTYAFVGSPIHGNLAH
jgi:hypothetical protein